MYKINKTTLIALGIVSAVFLNQASAMDADVANQSTGAFASLNVLPLGLMGSMGYQITPHFGVEFDALGAFGMDPFALQNVSIYGAAMRGVLPFGAHTELFGQLGVGVINGSETINIPLLPSVTVHGQSVGATYGLGLGYCFNKHWMASISGFGIYSTGSQVIKNGFKTVPMIGLTYHFA